jgi:hypothetical protein
VRRRRIAAWLLSLPLMVAGSQVAHALAYRLVYPQARVRLSALLSTGHGYLLGAAGYVPLLLGTLGAVELVAVGWVLAGSVRRSLQRPVPAWAFALLPIIGFTLQEVLERWLSSGRFPWWVVLAPTFQVGLALQLPFALLAYALARLLTRTAATAALILPSFTAVRIGACADPPVAACGHRGRGACTPAFRMYCPVRGPPALAAS